MRHCSSCYSVINSHLTFVTPWTTAHQASLSFTISWSLVQQVGDTIQLSHPLSPPSPFPSNFPALRSFAIIQLFESGGQNTRALALVLPLNIQGWFPLEFTGFISFSPRDSQEYFRTTVQKHQFFSAQSFFYSTTLISKHDYWKTHTFEYTVILLEKW